MSMNHVRKRENEISLLLNPRFSKCIMKKTEKGRREGCMMMHQAYDCVRSALQEPMCWQDGMEIQQISCELDGVEAKCAGMSVVRLQAELMACALKNTRIGVRREDLFAADVEIREGDRILFRRRLARKERVEAGEMRDLLAANQDGVEARAYCGDVDFNHTCPDWRRLMKLGIPGILAEARAMAARPGLEESMYDFYHSVELVYASLLELVARMEALARKAGAPEIAVRSLRGLREGAPGNTHEALQLILLYYQMQNNVDGTNVRSIGGLDQLLHPFIVRDLAQGTFDEAEINEILRFFFGNAERRHVGANLPFYLGGSDEKGDTLVNDTSFRIIDVYGKMGIYSPKMQIRVDAATPDDFLRAVLKCIRAGNNSFVFLNEKIIPAALRHIGVAPQDAWDYAVVGCYEPMAFGKEVPCTCNGNVNLAKALELAMNAGCDARTGKKIGADTLPAEEIGSFEEFVAAVRTQIAYLADRSMELICAYERHYGEIQASPVFSATYVSCMEKGMDAYHGGAVYNNSSINLLGLATTADSLEAVREVVYQEGRVTLPQLRDLLRNNWRENARLRLHCKNRCAKYGNGDERADGLARQMVNFACDCVNGRPNGRGGVFRAGLFTIDWNLGCGAKTGATPDGRSEGEPLSRNMGPSMACDRRGITAALDSVASVDYTRSPNGAVYDAMLHPSAVQGDSGLENMLSLVRVFMAKGGFGLQFNVFDANTLRKAQAEPEKYATLQVRVCGWNAYFVDLSEVEQNLFIRQAEAL